MTPEMNIYFAGAIRGGRQDAALYLEIVRQLRAYGNVLTEHIGDTQLSELGELTGDTWIHDRDLNWLKQSECLVAEVTTPSLGVGYELGKASEWGKRVLCLYRPGDGRSLSAMIAGCGGIKVQEYQTAAELKEVFDQFFGTAESWKNDAR
jgi:hypothetical protein